MDGQNRTKFSGVTRLLLRNIWVVSTPAQAGVCGGIVGGRVRFV